MIVYPEKPRTVHTQNIVSFYCFPITDETQSNRYFFDETHKRILRKRPQPPVDLLPFTQEAVVQTIAQAGKDGKKLYGFGRVDEIESLKTLADGGVGEKDVHDSILFVGTVLPLTTALAMETISENKKRLCQRRDALARLMGLGERAVVSGSMLGDWPVVRAMDNEIHFLLPHDSVLDSSGNGHYQLFDVGLPTASISGATSKTSGLQLLHAFEGLPTPKSADVVDSWCPLTRTGWPHDRAFANFAAQRLRRMPWNSQKLNVG